MVMLCYYTLSIGERIENSLNRFHYCMTITARWPPCRYVHCEAVSEPGVHSNDHTNADLQPNRLTAAAHIDSLQAFLARTRCPSFPRPRTLPFATSDFGPSQARQFPPHLLADPARAITLETRKYALPTTSSQTILRMSGRGAGEKDLRTPPLSGRMITRSDPSFWSDAEVARQR